MWYFLLNAILIVWLVRDGLRRKTKVLLWALACFFFGPVVVPVYLTLRPLKSGETREGGAGWNIMKNFALFWTITWIIGALWGLLEVGNLLSRIENEYEAAGAAIGSAIGLSFIAAIWFFPVVGALVLGIFLKKSIVEVGPTGPLANEPAEANGPAAQELSPSMETRSKSADETEKTNTNTNLFSPGMSSADPAPATAGAAASSPGFSHGKYKYPIIIVSGFLIILAVIGILSDSGINPGAANRETRKEWVEAIRGAGSNSKNTPPFQLTGGPVRMSYSFQGGDFAVFSVYLLKAGQDLMETGGFPEIMLMQADSGETMLYKKDGEYYLSIDSANGTWEVVILEEREIVVEKEPEKQLVAGGENIPAGKELVEVQSNETNIVSQTGKEWVSLISMSCRSSKNSSPFELGVNPVRIRYSLEGGDFSMLYAYVLESGTDLMETGGIPEIMIDGPENGESRLYKKPGTYYISVDSANGYWHIDVEEEKAITSVAGGVKTETRDSSVVSKQRDVSGTGSDGADTFKRIAEFCGMDYNCHETSCRNEFQSDSQTMNCMSRVEDLLAARSSTLGSSSDSTPSEHIYENSTSLDDESNVNEGISEFSKDFVYALNSGDADRLRGFYNDFVQYRGKNLTNDEIIKGMSDYYKKWPNVNFTLYEDITIIQKGNVAELTIPMKFMVENVKKNQAISGKTERKLIITKTEDKWKIIGDTENTAEARSYSNNRPKSEAPSKEVKSNEDREAATIQKAEEKSSVQEQRAVNTGANPNTRESGMQRQDARPQSDPNYHFSRTVNTYVNYLYGLNENDRAVSCYQYSKADNLTEYEKAAFKKACEITVRDRYTATPTERPAQYPEQPQQQVDINSVFRVIEEVIRRVD